MSKGNRSKRTLAILILFFAAIMSLIILYAGHFPFFEEEEARDKELQGDKAKKSPAVYKHISGEFKGNKQEINMLEIDLRNGGAEIKPVLSYDSVFGFEKLSSMFQRKGAYAAVNGGFFYEFGQPSGMVAIDGNLITKPTGKYPVFLIEGNRASLKEMNTSIKAVSDSGTIEIGNLNAFGKAGETVLYTPYFGPDNRAGTANLSVVIRNDVIEKIEFCKGKCTIPEDGMLLSFFLSDGSGVDSLPLKTGDKLKIMYQPEIPPGLQAYECGSWIVRNGRVVIGDKDEWVGLLTNRDPRTAVGIKEDGTVVLVTVDGRQPGYSVGLSGKELGELLLNYGVKDAAMLDGGASTEMIVEGKIVNKPSFRGKERLLGGALVVRLTGKHP